MTTRSHGAEVLFFSSPHCKQCAAVRPTAADVASSFEGVVQFREIDATADSETAKLHNVRGVPTLIALRDGGELGRLVGSRSHGEIARMFASVTAGKRTRQTISRPDRTLRLGVAAVFGVAAVVANAPVLWAFAAGAAVFGVWDLIRP
ncbi:MAG: thioredoxin family protein [Actinomycetota bacterium]